MKRISAGILIASLGLSFIGTTMIAAEAAPFPSLNRQGPAVDIEHVQYRRDHNRHVEPRQGRWDHGTSAGGTLATTTGSAAIGSIGAAIATTTAGGSRPRPSSPA